MGHLQTNYKSKAKIFFLLYLFSVFAFILIGCGNENDHSYATGAVSFSIRWPDHMYNSSRSSQALNAPVIDCAAWSIATIEVDVYNPANQLLAGDIFPCTRGAGTVTGIPVGANRAFTITAKTVAGGILYQGAIPNITITENIITDCGTAVLGMIDSDSDNVPDGLDNCAGTIGGLTVDLFGCSADQESVDSDDDGVVNVIDLCPNTPDGNTVDNNGCADSQKDSDDDGVTDDLDLCVNTPTGTQVDSTGCTLTTGVVVYYPFNGNANDESGNGNNGTVYGAVLTTDRFGNANSAYTFDGNDHIDIPNTEPFELTNEITIAAWAKITTDTGSNNQRIISFGPFTNGFEVFYWSASGKVPAFKFGDQWIQGDDALSLNEWYFYTAVADSNGARLYINGQLVAESFETPSNFNYQDPLSIGRMAQTNGKWDYWYGQIDDLRVYNYAISEDEITALYNEGNELNNGLVAYYPLNGNANDASGNGHDGVGSGGLNYVEGIEGQAIAFDGVDDIVNIAHDSQFNNSEITIAAWIKTDATNAEPEGNHWTYLVFKGDHENYQYGIIASGNPDVELVTAASMYWTGAPSYDVDIPYTSISDANWHLLVAVMTSTYTTFYLDGQSMGTDTTLSYSWNINSTANIHIGGHPNLLGGGNGYFEGTIDEIRIYNRVLTETEIEGIYNLP